MQQNRVIVRLDYIRQNALLFKNKVKSALFCAVVKADAYGHGAESVAQSLDCIADCFAVSLIEEGAQLRYGGIVKDVLVLTPPLCEEDVVEGILMNLIFTVGDISDYRLILSVCRKYNSKARIHIKVNTGMNRYGFSYSGFKRFLRGDFSPCISVEGIYSHFYRPEYMKAVRYQYDLFQKFSKAAESVFGRLICHIAATGGALYSSDYAADMVRVGLGLYGYVPAGFEKVSGLKPAMEVYATVSASHGCTKGGAGYGNFKNPNTRIGIIRAGYADGFFRNGGIGNINNLCMDASLTVKQCKKYDEICLMNNADKYAAHNATISYDVLVRMGGRARKIYVE